MLWFLLVSMFVLGAIVGSLLNVCIYRLPLEKSIVWPGSRCGHCLQSVHWYDNIPLVSYWVLGGKCRTCGARFSMRYFLIELFTGLVFAGLFYLEIYRNVNHVEALNLDVKRINAGYPPSWTTWTFWGYRTLLVCFLIVASFCDLDYREIPLSITVPGTLLGLAGAIFLSWPWPLLPSQAAIPEQIAWGGPNLSVKEGLYPWPFWGPLPGWFAPGGNWQTGLLTGLVGAFAGTVLLRVIRFVFTLGLGIEALGLGDADLMMMAGAFLGWQAVVVAFFLGVFAGLFFGILQIVIGGDNMMPFGPSLAIGTVAAFLGWHWIGPQVQIIFFNGVMMLILGGASCVFLLVASYVLRVIRLMRE
jgi:leader peptidase (prepilin peptidase)/N-methyltransferase